ncbi:MAG: putative ABC transport system permease protein [Pseudohongiellaceae bacterium]|jgi:putative ABC transport system permease protein
MLPLRYSMRNVVVRRSSALLTTLGIALTVAVFAGVLSMREGFQSIYRSRGESDVAIYLRPGAGSEGESAIRREQAEILIKERPEIERDAAGKPLAAMETFLAVYMEQISGGQVNVPIRGIQQASLEIMGDAVQLVDGRWMRWDSDEVVVGLPLTERMQGARIGDTITLNLTPFKVVGVVTHSGAQGSEVWGDVNRMIEALDRPFYQRVVAQVKPDTDFAALTEELRSDKRVPMQVLSEADYLAKQTTALSTQLTFLAGFLTLLMGASAVLGAMNTMLASVASRTHEIGVLLSLGYSRTAIFVTFLFESALIGLLGGALGVLISLPFDGLGTGLTNFNTFTDVSFSFDVTPQLMLTSVGLSLALGIIGGALPALRAARLPPVTALRGG